VWTGERQRGVQLHKLAEAVATWRERYGQRAWTRQLEGAIERLHEDRLMEMIERFDGRAFPTIPRLGELVQLHAALALAGPHVRQGAPELGVPQQGGKVVQRNDHSHVIDGAVGHGLDCPVRERPASKQPQVTGGGGLEGVG